MKTVFARLHKNYSALSSQVKHLFIVSFSYAFGEFTPFIFTCKKLLCEVKKYSKNIVKMNACFSISQNTFVSILTLLSADAKLLSLFTFRIFTRNEIIPYRFFGGYS